MLLAGLLWKRTTASQAWIAEYLGMKNVANVSMAKLTRFVSEKMNENEP